MPGSLRRAVQGFPEGGKRIRLGQGGKMGGGGGFKEIFSLELTHSVYVCIVATLCVCAHQNCNNTVLRNYQSTETRTASHTFQARTSMRRTHTPHSSTRTPPSKHTHMQNMSPYRLNHTVRDSNITFITNPSFFKILML
jgi:hypothetical protein